MRRSLRSHLLKRTVCGCLGIFSMCLSPSFATLSPSLSARCPLFFAVSPRAALSSLTSYSRRHHIEKVGGERKGTAPTFILVTAHLHQGHSDGCCFVLFVQMRLVNFGQPQMNENCKIHGVVVNHNDQSHQVCPRKGDARNDRFRTRLFMQGCHLRTAPSKLGQPAQNEYPACTAERDVLEFMQAVNAKQSKASEPL